MEINNIKVDHFLKKIIDDKQYHVFEKYISFINSNDLKYDFDDIDIDGKSVVEYIVENNEHKFLKILDKYNFNLNNSFNETVPSIISAKNNDIRSLNIFLKNRKSLLHSNNNSILIQLAKNNSISIIKKILNDDRIKDILRIEDEKSNNFLFYIDDLNILKKTLLIDRKILNTINWNNDDLVLHFAKKSNYLITKFFINEKLYKIKNINYQDCNIIHYLIKNEWFDLLEKVNIKKLKKEYNICNIDGNDLFLELLINSDDENFSKFWNFFYNKNLTSYYIKKITELDNKKIKIFIKYNINLLSDNDILNIFISLLEENKKNIILKLLEEIWCKKSKQFIELLENILEKYLKNYMN